MHQGLAQNSVALVTGASGFSGSLLVRKLVACGVEVRAIARQSSDLTQFGSLALKWFRGDVFDPETIKTASQGVDYIFHLAAAYREAGIKDETYFKVHVESTRLLAEAAIKNPNFKRFIHISTVGVHGHIDNPPAAEDYRFSPGDVYQETKAQAELWLHQFAKSNKLPYCVIRPAAIYGPADKRLFKVFKLASKPFFPILGNGKCLYHLIHVDDLCDAIILAATAESALGQAFIIGNPNANSLSEIATIISKELGRKTRVIRIPAEPFFLLAALCEAVCKPLGLSPPIYKRRVAFFTKDRSFDTTKMQTVLGYVPKYSSFEGLIETTRWYVENKWLKRI